VLPVNEQFPLDLLPLRLDLLPLRLDLLPIDAQHIENKRRFQAEL
jgi:hypothetical protein